MMYSLKNSTPLIPPPLTHSFSTASSPNLETMEIWRARWAQGCRCVRVRKSNVVVSATDHPPSSSSSSSSSNANAGREYVDLNPTHGDILGHPPSDDCCPICFGAFSVPCKAICGHWYCGSCILQYWNYSAASKPCKCPMCFSSITKLTPEVSLHHLQDEDVTKILENIQRYNRLFVGGARGLILRVRESPLFIKRIFQQMMDPDRPDSYIHEMRLFAMILGVLYAASPFHFIPTGGLGIVRLFDYAAIAFVLVLRLVGIYRRRRLTQRVRNLAAAMPLGE